ncbi:YihY/virulence factor BrkB family protein [Nocardiopsis coralliicola]
MRERLESSAGQAVDAVRQWAGTRPVAGGAVLLVARTARSVTQTRILGLAAESAFFSLLSLPALLLGLVGTLGHLTSVLGADTVSEIRRQLLALAADALTSETVDSLVAPLVDSFLRGAQGGVLSVTFLVSLWSGSRALNVFIEAITISYGLDGLRGYVRQRILALLAYLGALVFCLVVLPVMVVGPDVVAALLPAATGYLGLLYWPTVAAASVAAVTALYLLAVPERVSVRRLLPGGVLATAILMVGSALLRVYLDASFGQPNIYGSLSSPIAVLAWLWLMAFAVLIGSSLNAEIDLMWPTPRTAAARAELAAHRHRRATRQVQRHEQALQEAHERRGGDGSGSEGGAEGGAAADAGDAAPGASGAGGDGGDGGAARGGSGGGESAADGSSGGVQSPASTAAASAAGDQSPAAAPDCAPGAGERGAGREGGADGPERGGPGAAEAETAPHGGEGAPEGDADRGARSGADDGRSGAPDAGLATPEQAPLPGRAPETGTRDGA